MTKVNFTKVEGAFDLALRKLFVDNLSDLAAIANVLQDPLSNPNSKTVEAVILRFQTELKKIKKQDPTLFQKLGLSPEEEERLNSPYENYQQEDWLRLKALKEKIDELK